MLDIRLMVYCRNIWGPNKQPGMVDVIAEHYGISHRFHAILKSSPPPKPEDEGPPTAAKLGTITANKLPRNDIELANGTAEKQPVGRVGGPEDINHYAIAKHLINFQSLDLGEKCMSLEAVYHCHRC
jgi:hypothetical protein